MMAAKWSPLPVTEKILANAGFLPLTNPALCKSSASDLA